MATPDPEQQATTPAEGTKKEAARKTEELAQKAAAAAAASPHDPNTTGLALLPAGTVVTVFGLVSAHQYNAAS